jgi:hypothetical protein
MADEKHNSKQVYHLPGGAEGGPPREAWWDLQAYHVLRRSFLIVTTKATGNLHT